MFLRDLEEVYRLFKNIMLICKHDRDVTNRIIIHHLTSNAQFCATPSCMC